MLTGKNKCYLKVKEKKALHYMNNMRITQIDAFILAQAELS